MAKNVTVVGREVRILKALASVKGELSRKQIQEKTGITKGFSVFMKNLSDQKLVTTNQLENDRNFYHGLTAAGRELVKSGNLPAPRVQGERKAPVKKAAVKASASKPVKKAAKKAAKPVAKKPKTAVKKDKPADASAPATE